MFDIPVKRILSGLRVGEVFPFPSKEFEEHAPDAVAEPNCFSCSVSHARTEKVLQKEFREGLKVISIIKDCHRLSVLKDCLALVNFNPCCSQHPTMLHTNYCPDGNINFVQASQNWISQNVHS